jgi:hypothetical protein
MPTTYFTALTLFDTGAYTSFVNREAVASPPPHISNDELVKINPMFQHLIANDPDAFYPHQAIHARRRLQGFHQHAHELGWYSRNRTF